jgi:hypothetical protein
MSTFAPTAEPGTIPRVFVSWQRGAGEDVAKVEQRIRELNHYYISSDAYTYRQSFLAETFRRMAEEWRQSTMFESSMDRITGHPAYRAIVQLGEEVLPLLLEELRQQPEPWFTALRQITQTDPVRQEQRGDMKAMADAWVRWGQANGLLR